MTTLDALKLAQYWHKEWKAALERKEFDRAEEYFSAVREWRRKANVGGMLGQNFDEAAPWFK